MRSVSKLIAWAFALAPVVLLLSTWGEHLSALQQVFRMLGIPVVGAETAIIIMSALQGLKLSRPPAWVAAALVALLVLAWATAITAFEAPASIIRTSLWTVHLTFGLAIANLVAAGTIEPDDFPPAIAAGFVLFTALLLVFVASVYRPSYDWVEGLPAYSNIRWYGFYAAAAVGLCSHGFLKADKRYWLVAVLAIGASMWTGSRGALYAAILGYVGAALLFPALREGWRRFAGAVICGLALAALLTWLAPIGAGIGRMTEVTTTLRLEIWKVAVEFIAKRPIFGWGEEQIRFMPTPFPVVQPHNVVLQILLAWGVVGLLLVASLAAWLLGKLLKVPAPAPFLLPLSMIAVFALVDSSLFQVQSVATFALCLALATSSRKDLASPRPSLVRDSQADGPNP